MVCDVSQRVAVFSVSALHGLPIFLGLKCYENRFRPSRRCLGLDGKRAIKEGTLMAMRIHANKKQDRPDVKWIAKYEAQIRQHGHTSVADVAKRICHKKTLGRVIMLMEVDCVLQLDKDEANNLPQHMINKLGMWNDERYVRYRADKWRDNSSSILSVILFKWMKELVPDNRPLITNNSIDGDLRMTPAWLKDDALNQLKKCQLVSNLGFEQVDYV